jgi:hypothetical protein
MRNDKAPLKVLGIALIVDEKGIGARLVARYPTSQPSKNKSRDLNGGSGGAEGDEIRLDLTKLVEESAEHHHDDEEEEEEKEDDLFFTLTSHQMAKLFRTKKALCNQPMTLRVNRTIFCCHAALMESYDDEIPKQSQLTLFSVVVALSAPAREAVVPFGNFWDSSMDSSSDNHVTTALPTTNDDHLDLERYLRHVTQDAQEKNHPNDSSTSRRKNKSTDIARKKKTAARVSSAFLAIRRVHISLARLCRALEREERRCAYVSLQSQDFFHIRNERQKQWEALQGNRHLHGSSQSAGGTTGSGGGGGGGSTDHPPPRKPRHVRHASFGAAAGSATGAVSSLEQALQNLTVTPAIPQEQEKEQEILELMLSAPPNRHSRHYGNLVGELVSVFHSLSRSDHNGGSIDDQEEEEGGGRDGHPPTPSSLLCEQGSVVYINQHLAVPMEAVGKDTTTSDLTPSSGSTGPSTVQPYHTLLFPHASPSELLQTFQAAGSMAPQRLEQLLLTVNPQKSLAEIAIDANLPMHTTMQMASFLVSHGAAVVSDVISSHSRLTCLNIDLIPILSLDFSQAFPGVHLFGVVAFLTTSRTLGATMANLTAAGMGPTTLNHGDSFDLGSGSGDDDDMTAWIQESLMTSQAYQNRLKIRATDSSKKAGGGRTIGGSSKERTPDDSFHQPFSHISQPPPALEEGLFHQYQYQQHYKEQQQYRVKELEELLYSMAIWLLSHGIITHLQEYIVVLEATNAVESTDENENNTQPADDILFQELMDFGYLNGNLSLQSLAWRLGMSKKTLRAWGHRYNRVRIFWRVPLTVSAMSLNNFHKDKGGGSSGRDC